MATEYGQQAEELLPNYLVHRDRRLLRIIYLLAVRTARLLPEGLTGKLGKGEHRNTVYVPEEICCKYGRKRVRLFIAAA